MTAVVRSTQGHPARSLFLALPLAVMACGGDESASTVAEAEARPIATVASVAPPAPDPALPASGVAVRTLGGATPAPPATFETALDAYRAGNFRVAREMYRTRADSNPEDAYGLYMLGLASWKSGDFTGALVAFDRSIGLTPWFAKAYFNKARTLLDMRRVPEAMEVIAKGREIDSTSSEGWRLLARAQAEGGDPEAAKATYRVLLTQNEADAWGLNNLGMLHFGEGDVAGSLGPLARAVQVNPTAPLFLNNLGMALERSGYPVAALHRYELAVRHDPSYLKASKNLERMQGVVTDTTLTDEVDVRGLAEQFRLTVRSWTP